MPVARRRIRSVNRRRSDGVYCRCPALSRATPSSRPTRSYQRSVWADSPVSSATPPTVSGPSTSGTSSSMPQVSTSGSSFTHSRLPLRVHSKSRGFSGSALQRGQDLEVVRVVHDADDVAEGVDDRRRAEAGVVASLNDSLEDRGAQLDQALQFALQVVDVPVDDRAGGAVAYLVRRVLGVDDPQFALEVAEPELDVRRLLEARYDVVRLDPQQLRVPLPRRLHVRGVEADGGESSHHLGGPSLGVPRLMT